MKRMIYAGIMAFTFIFLQGCETQSQRDSDVNKDAAHKRNNRADYAEKTQQSN